MRVCRGARAIPARAAGRLRHPNIVTVYEAGEERGISYLAMEVVPGRGLDDILRQGGSEGLPALRDVLRWGKDLAKALACAHAEGLVHRDVKPSNVRITPDGRAVLLDFGLARDLRSPGLSRAGEFHGSAHYASPEQVSAGSDPIDARSDVYSLGVALYECLSGTVPFIGETTERLFQRILHAEPPALRRRRASLPADVEAIVGKALEKRPQDRYPDAAAMAADLACVLEFRPIAARPPSLVARLRKWTRRRPAVATSVVLGALLATSLPLVVLWQQGLRLRAVRELVRVSEGMRLATDSALVLESNPGVALLLARESLARHPSLLGRNALARALDHVKEIRTFAGHEADLGGARFLPGEDRILTWDRRGETRIWEAATGRATLVTQVPADPLWDAALDPTGRWLFYAPREGPAGFLDLQTQQLSGAFEAGKNWPMTAGFGVGGNVLAVLAVVGAAGELRIVASDGFATVASLEIPDRVAKSLVWSADGRVLAAGGRQGTVRIWRAESWKPLDVPPPGRADLTALQLDAAGERFLAVSWNGAPWLGDARSGEILHRFEPYGELGRSGTLDRAGTQAAVASADGTIRVWDCRSGELLHEFTDASETARAIAFSPDGGRLAASAADGTILIWEMASGRLQRLAGHESEIERLGWNEAGDLLLSASKGLDRSARLWRPDAPGFSRVLVELDTPINSARFLPGGARISLVCPGSVREVPLEGGPPLPASHAVPSRTGRAVSVGLDPIDGPPGTRIACSEANRVAILDAATGLVRQQLPDFPQPLYDLSYDAPSQILAVAGREGGRWFWDCRAGAFREDFVPTTGEIARIAFGPDGTALAAICVIPESHGERTAIQVWDPRDGSPLLQRETSDAVTGMVVGPGAAYLAILVRGEARLWSLRPDLPDRNLRGHESVVRDVAFSGDGRWLATAGDDATVRLWQIATGEEWLTLAGHEGGVSSVDFAPDGRAVLSAGQDGTARLWPVFDLETMAAARAPREFTSAERAKFKLDLERSE